jgi:uncharacterized surface protein with fasciclin (FAS1) repeats
MKKCVLCFLFVLNANFLFAQKEVEKAALIDSVKAKWGRVKKVDGTPMISSNDIIENISLSVKYSILLKAIDDAGLSETFKSKGPITFFAPDNKAFGKLSSGKLDTLLQPAHKYDLSYLVTYHALAGRITARDISRKINANNGEATFTTIAGGKLTAKIDSNRNIVLIDENGGESVIDHFDIPQSNGLLHTVNAVLVPKVKSI